MVLPAIDALLLSAGKPRLGALIEVRSRRAAGAASCFFSRGSRNKPVAPPGVAAVGFPLSYRRPFRAERAASWQHGLWHSPPAYSGRGLRAVR